MGNLNVWVLFRKWDLIEKANGHYADNKTLNAWRLSIVLWWAGKIQTEWYCSDKHADILACYMLMLFYSSTANTVEPTVSYHIKLQWFSVRYLYLYVSRSIIPELSELVFDSWIFYTYKSVYSSLGELYQPLWCHSGVIRVISALIWRPQISNRKFVWHTGGVSKLWVFTRQEGSKEEMLSGSIVFLELDSSQGLKKISQPRCSYLF